MALGLKTDEIRRVITVGAGEALSRIATCNRFT
jgi:hypothetical protein